jgi:hypothetical protein
MQVHPQLTDQRPDLRPNGKWREQYVKNKSHLRVSKAFSLDSASVVGISARSA